MDQKPFDMVVSGMSINPPSMMKNNPQPTDSKRLFKEAFSESIVGAICGCAVIFSPFDSELSSMDILSPIGQKLCP
jgi:hypothetical protein